MRLAATLCALAITALLCGACSSANGDHGSSAMTQRHTAQPAPRKVASTTQAQHQSPTPRTGTGGTQFCAVARKIGLANVRIVDSSNPDAKELLPGIDRLNATAPAGIKADFNRFAQLEHDLLDPGHTGPQAVPDARTYTALRRIQSYLRNTAVLSGCKSGMCYMFRVFPGQSRLFAWVACAAGAVHYVEISGGYWLG